MKTITVLASAGFAVLGSISMAQAQSQPNPIQGTPGSYFPYAAAHEVVSINGVPCRTVLGPNGTSRVVVECANTGVVDRPSPMATGSIRSPMTTGSRAMGSAPAQGTPSSPFPYAAPHEVVVINGVPCRTTLGPDGNSRVIVACAQQ